MSPTIFNDLDQLLGAPPAALGTTGWVVVAEAELVRFAAATGQVSPYFSLALTNRLLPDLMQVPVASSGVNYGAESVRFGTPISAGDRVRCSASLVGASAVPGGVQTVVEALIEIEGRDEPACVVLSLSRWLR